MKPFKHREGKSKTASRVRPDWFEVIYVRTGEYRDSHTGLTAGVDDDYLTSKGKNQARAAAKTIRRHIGDDAVVVVGGGHINSAYDATTRIIANELGVQVEDGLFVFEPNVNDIYRLYMKHIREGRNRFVRIENGSFIGDRLLRYVGPSVHIGFLGPDLGSVHILRFKFLGASNEIAERFFIDIVD